MDELQQIGTTLIEKLEKIGLYVDDVVIAGEPDSEDIVEKIMSDEISPEDALNAGLVKFQIMGLFRIGDVALSDRVLNPESFKELREFEIAMPSDLQYDLEEIRREMEGWGPIS